MGTRRTGEPRGIVVAVDGGGSKTDAAVVDAASGDVLGRYRGGPCSHLSLIHISEPTRPY